MIGDVERDALGLLRDAGIAGRADRAASVSGLAAIFQASACSRPPEPKSRMFTAECSWLRKAPGRRLRSTAERRRKADGGRRVAGLDRTLRRGA